MLRLLFVLTIAAFGAAYSVRGPFYTLLLYLWQAYFRPDYWVWGGMAGIVGILPLSLVTGACLLIYSIFSSARFRWTFRTTLLFVLLVHSLISTTLSTHFEYAWPYWVDFAKSTVVTYLIACLVTSPQQYRLTLVIIALSLGFEVAKQGWLQLLLNPGERNINDHPFLGDENGVALGVLMFVPVVTAVAQTATRKWERAGYALLTVGAAYRAISTYSRGGFLSAGVLAVMYFLRSKHKVRTALAVVAVCLVIVPVMPDAFWNRMSTIAFSEQALHEEDNSSRGRLHFWRVAVAMASANPVFGVGHNAYNPHYDTYDFLGGLHGTGRAVHSTWFGILAELGYVGAFVFACTLVLAILGAGRVRRMALRGEISPDLGIYATALERSFAAFCVGATFLSAQYLEMFWHLIGLSIALTAIAEEARSTVRAKEQTPHGAPAFTPAALPVRARVSMRPGWQVRS